MKSEESVCSENKENQNIETISNISQEVQSVTELSIDPAPVTIPSEEEVIASVEATESVDEEIKAQAAVEESIAAGQTTFEIVTEIEQENILSDTQEFENQENDEECEDASAKSTDSIEAEYASLSYEETVAMLEQVVREPNFNLIKLNVSILRGKILDFIKEENNRALEAFLAEGGVKGEFMAEHSALEQRFNAALHKFKENKAKFLDSLEAEKQKNLGLKQAIINGLKELVETESNLKVLNDKFKEFQETWKNIGPVPQSESTNLWQSYHFYVEKFFDILRINKELRSLDLKKNLEQKITLCEQAEELLVDESVTLSFKKLQELHEKWREIGPVPDDKKEEIWERFKNASDNINQRRREHYERIFTEQQNNYNAKVVLCEKAEELLANTEVKSVKEQRIIGKQLSDLLEVWKTLGATPPKLNEGIWKRFKGSLDKFSQERREQTKKVWDEQMQNYNLKLNLAIRAEGIADRTDWKQASAEMIALQKEWKEIGAVPYKHSDAVWKRFRAACDNFFTKRATYFGSKQDIEAENLKKKEALIERVINQEFGEDKNANLEILKEIQREWMETGHVTKSEQDRIYKSYREAINKRFEELKISAKELHREKFRSRVDTVLDDPNAGKLIIRERNFLTSILKELKDDVLLWENNLGFFAHSKNANLLREEFTKKIDDAKAQIKDLEYKIRMLNNPKKKMEEAKPVKPVEETALVEDAKSTDSEPAPETPVMDTPAILEGEK
jgi:hypothetical protein